MPPPTPAVIVTLGRSGISKVGSSSFSYFNLASIFDNSSKLCFLRNITLFLNMSIDPYFLDLVLFLNEVSGESGSYNTSNWDSGFNLEFKGGIGNKEEP